MQFSKSWTLCYYHRTLMYAKIRELGKYQVLLTATDAPELIYLTSEYILTSGTKFSLTFCTLWELWQFCADWNLHYNMEQNCLRYIPLTTVKWISGLLKLFFLYGSSQCWFVATVYVRVGMMNHLQNCIYGLDIVQRRLLDIGMHPYLTIWLRDVACRLTIYKILQV